MAAMELFFEIQRKKTHVLAETRENGTVNDLKDIISGIILVQPNKITLKRPKNEAQTEWENLDGERTLLDCGFTQKNARPDEPAILAFTLPEDNDQVQLTPLSVPPPLPDAMQNTEMSGNMES